MAGDRGSNTADRPNRRRLRADRRQSERIGRERALLGGIVRLVGLLAITIGIVLAVLTLGPIGLDDIGGFDDLEFNDLPSPSAEPPETGDRNPNLTDPDDPGDSELETEVEPVSAAVIEDFVHAEVNDRRADYDLGELEWDGTVASVARAHSYDMADREYFDHVSPDSEGPFERFQAVGEYCQGYGENIALTYLDQPVNEPGGDETVTYQTAEGVASGLVDQWMNSTDHRAAILEEDGTPDWDRGGVGVYLTDDGSVYASHNFCQTW